MLQMCAPGNLGEGPYPLSLRAITGNGRAHPTATWPTVPSPTGSVPLSKSAPIDGLRVKQGCVPRRDEENVFPRHVAFVAPASRSLGGAGTTSGG